MGGVAGLGAREKNPGSRSQARPGKCRTYVVPPCNDIPDTLDPKSPLGPWPPPPDNGANFQI